MTEQVVCPKRIELYSEEPIFSDTSDEDIRPYAEYFEAPEVVDTGIAMLALPGGAYSFLSKLSGTHYGTYFASKGISVMSVSFRLGSNGYDGRAFCADAYAAVRALQSGSLGGARIPNEVGVIGTSAGGHLAGMLSTGAAEALLTGNVITSDLPLSWRPSFAVFCYGVLSLEAPLRHIETATNFLGSDIDDRRRQFASSPIRHVSADHCRSFLWHTAEDTEVSVQNTLEMYQSLSEHGVPSELHIYEKGPHALGLAKELKGKKELFWADEAARWILGSDNQPINPPSF